MNDLVVRCTYLDTTRTDPFQPIDIFVTGAMSSLTQMNYRIWINIGKKKKTPGIQESLCLSV